MPSKQFKTKKLRNATKFLSFHPRKMGREAPICSSLFFTHLGFPNKYQTLKTMQTCYSNEILTTLHLESSFKTIPPLTPYILSLHRCLSQLSIQLRRVNTMY